MRVLVAIGCDEYDDPALSDLRGAVNDARDIYDLLVESGVGEYHQDESQLLKSPTLAEAVDVVSHILFDLGPIDVLTVFYAGHGALKDGSYFVCLKDTRADRLSVSSLGLSQLFTWLNEANVRHTNIVIDSCHCGGLARDIGSFLKPESVGRFGSPSVSIFASAAADQTAREIDGHGVGTACLLRCLNGNTVVQTNRPSVGLVEVGLVASELLSRNVHQTSVCWGLSLFGQSQLAQNLCFVNSGARASALDLPLAGNPLIRAIVEKHASQIWALYLDAANEFDIAQYLKLSRAIIDELPNAPSNAPLLVQGLADTFVSALQDGADPFEIVELYGASIAVLTPYCELSPESDTAIIELSCALLEAISASMQVTLDILENNEFALLSDNFALSDLYFLPLRVLRTLGWIGAGEYIEQQISTNSLFNRSVAKALVRKILGTYMGSVVAVSDEQSPHLLAFIWACEVLELNEELELALGLLYQSYHRFGCEVARPNLSGAQALQFLMGRARLDYRSSEGLLARPCEILPALFTGFRRLGIPEVIDESIEELDFTSINMFVPQTYRDYAQVSIEDGVNHSLHIGHNIWSMDDFDKVWTELANEIAGKKCLAVPGVRIGAMCASIVMPDRSAWFLFC